MPHVVSARCHLVRPLPRTVPCMKHPLAISRVVLEVVLLTMCSCTVTTPCDDGVDLPPCVDCGPGAVLSGRFFCPDFPTSRMDDGQVVRQVGNVLEWLDGR